MKVRSATALGASLLALALPTAAHANTLGGVTDGLGSTKVEAKVVTGGPIDAKADLKGKIDGRLHNPLRTEAKAKAKSGGAEARQHAETGGGAQLETRVRAHRLPVRSEVRIKARLDRGEGRDLMRHAEVAREAVWHTRRTKGRVARKAARLAHAKHLRKSRMADRSRGAAGPATKGLERRGRVTSGRLGRSLSTVGREVGNPLQAGLAGGLLLGLGGLAGAAARAGFKRGLR